MKGPRAWRKAYGERVARNATRICYSHVPKCAGVAVSRSIAGQAFSWRERKFVPNFSIDLRASSRAAAATSRSMMELREDLLAYALAQERYKFVSAHVGARPCLVEAFRDRWHFVTLLRNPVDRWISEFVYNTHKSSSWARNPLSIEDYLGTPAARTTATSFLRYFSNMPEEFEGEPEPYEDEAVANLSTFTVVGFLEEMDAFIGDFQKVFGTRLKIPRRNESPRSDLKERIRSEPGLMDGINNLCAVDTRIYRRVSEIRSADVGAA